MGTNKINVHVEGMLETGADIHAKEIEQSNLSKHLKISIGD